MFFLSGPKIPVKIFKYINSVICNSGNVWDNGAVICRKLLVLLKDQILAVLWHLCSCMC